MSQPLDIRGIASLSDKVSPVIAKIGAVMAAVSRNPALSRVAAQAGQVTAALGSVASGAKYAAINIAAVGAIGVAGLAAVSGLAVRVSRDFADVGSEIGDSAKRVGVSSEALQEWRYAADKSGASSAQLESGLQALNKRVGDVARGKAKDTAALFKKLGISVKDSHGKIKPLTQLLPQLAEAFKKNKDPATRAAMAAALGGQAFADLIPFLSEGRDGLRDLAAEARALGVIIPDSDVEAATRLSDGFKDLGKAFQGVMLTIGAKLAPIIQPIVDSMLEWAKANREWIATQVAEYARDLAEFLKGIDFSAIARGVRDLLSTGAAFVDMIGGWKVALIGLATVLAGPVIGPLINLGVQIAKLAGMSLAAGGWPVILGLAALAGALRNWEEFSAGIGRIWDGFKTLFSGDVFAGVNAIWSGAFATLTSLLRGFALVIDDVFGTDLAGKFDALKNVWPGISAAAEAGIQGVKDVITGVGEWLQTNLVAPFQLAVEQVKAIWASMSFSMPSISGPMPVPGSGNKPIATPWRGPAPAPPAAPAAPGQQGALPAQAQPTVLGQAAPIQQGSLMQRDQEIRSQQANALTGKASLNVKFENAPPGTKVASSQSGFFEPVNLNMGYGMRGVG